MSSPKELIKRMLNVINGKSYTDLANFLDISRNTIDVWIRRGKIPEKNLIKFCQLTNTKIDWLLTGEGEMYQNKQTSQTPLNKDDEELKVICKYIKELNPENRKKVLKYILDILLS